MGNTVQALPSNVLCEQELLSGIFYDTSILPEVIDKLYAEDFYMNSHQIIYSAIKKLFLPAISQNSSFSTSSIACAFESSKISKRENKFSVKKMIKKIRRKNPVDEEK